MIGLRKPSNGAIGLVDFTAIPNPAPHQARWREQHRPDDVENAGGEVVYDDNGTAELVIDGNLISGKHPGILDRFNELFLAEIEKAEK